MNSVCNGLPTFEKLQDESNYSIWKFQMELYLLHSDLWKYILMTPGSEEFDIKEDQMVRAKIGLMVDKSCLSHLKQTKTAREAWEALRIAYEDAGISSRGRLLAKLVNMKLEQFGSIKKYVAEVMSVAQKLKDMDKEVDDELLAIILLQGLSEEYTPVRFTIENSNSTLTADYVKSKLLCFAAQNTSLDGDEYCWVRMPTKRQQKTGQTTKTSKGKLDKCRICGGDHALRECPELSVKVESKEKARGRSRNPNPWRRSLPFGEKNTTESKDWIMDSEDHADMTKRKDYPCFLTFARLTMCCLVRVFKLW